MAPPCMVYLFTYISFEKSSKCRYILPFPWVLWVGKERWKNILTRIFFHFFSHGWLFQLRLLSSDLGGAMYHWALFSWSIPQRIIRILWTVEQCLCDFGLSSFELSIFHIFQYFPFSLGCFFSYFKGFIGKKNAHPKSSPKNHPTKTPQKCVRCRRCRHHFWAFLRPGVKRRPLRS